MVIPTTESPPSGQLKRLSCAPGLDLPRWAAQQLRSRSRLGALVFAIAIFLLWGTQRASFTSASLSSSSSLSLSLCSSLSSSSSAQQIQPFSDVEILNADATTRMPHIAPKIWQIFLSFTPSVATSYYVNSWIANSPSHTYTILDAAGALAVVKKLAEMPDHEHVLPLFYSMSRRVLRGDFLRYLVLAIEGGVYSDMDTQMIQPLHKWVPDEFKPHTRLIVGLEADRSPPIPGTTYEVQFCQWTLAGAAGHPAFWAMVERILHKMQDRPFANPPNAIDFSNDEVLEITGPAGWTEIVYEHLSRVAGEPVTWRNLTGMREPILIGDTVILPINGFATGVPHSNASTVTVPATMVKHQFQGTWKDGHS